MTVHCFLAFHSWPTKALEVSTSHYFPAHLPIFLLCILFAHFLLFLDCWIPIAIIFNAVSFSSSIFPLISLFLLCYNTTQSIVGNIYRRSARTSYPDAGTPIRTSNSAVVYDVVKYLDTWRAMTRVQFRLYWNILQKQLFMQSFSFYSSKFIFEELNFTKLKFCTGAVFVINSRKLKI